MRETDVRAHIEQFLRTTVRKAVLPLGLGMALAGCSPEPNAKYSAPVPDATADVQAPAPDYMAPMPDAGTQPRYAAVMPDADFPQPIYAAAIPVSDQGTS